MFSFVRPRCPKRNSLANRFSGAATFALPPAALVGQMLEERWMLAFTGEIELQTVVSGLSSPVTATHAADGSGRLFVAQQGGTIRIVQNGVLQATAFLDISSRIVSGGERGLLGLAFDPEYAVDDAAGEGKFYVYYSAPATSGGDHDSVVAEYRVSESDPNRADPNSERVLLRFRQPFSNHNGGDLKFGPDDGMLYISSGDGGSGGDPQNNAQNRNTLLGKILRIDVNGANGPGGQYGIPSDNPFVGQVGVRQEIFAYGFRNPFRMSFDNGPSPASPDRLFVGDVGQNAWEEVDLVVSGGNYGWRIREGAHPFNESDPDPGNLIDPIAEYPNSEKGIAVIGGFVYRGQEFASLKGVYVFGDLTGRLFVLEETGGRFELSEPIVVGGNPIGANIHGFGEDAAGEIYVLTTNSLRRITVNEPQPTSPWRNPDLAEDIDDDGAVEISDIVAMVQFLRDNGIQPELPVPDESLAPPPYVDPTGDGAATLADLLAVVTVIRERRAAMDGEGEQPESHFDQRSDAALIHDALFAWDDDHRRQRLFNP